MLLMRLRRETADLHAAVERRLDVMDPRLSAGRYVGTLATFYGFHAAWEAAVRSAAGPARLDLPAVLDLMSSRWREPSLRADLAHFAVDPDAVEPCDDLPPVDRPGRLLGSLYVMEGSTLGGQVVARHLGRALGLADGVGYAYFRGHGDQTGRRWREFAARLAELAAGLPEDDVVAGARDTFAALGRWFDCRAGVAAATADQTPTGRNATDQIATDQTPAGVAEVAR
ncbi:MAG: bacteriophytochrome heme oxygenase BphO [uncultured Phycisphaerae bacterium]|uniref:Bacteriophytochrome heme oxygenase BphO n=1 Tax=uncultured Phycisphaerae bacterium TaxID=904963 RepID=A0A6J4QFA0_9BACT|nr:MAG: bacteriophytochrome heme oxygenase BphO [uncultured Phycisphaerae bacterium]